MPTARLYNIGAYGQITDLPPHELPLEAFLEARNLRVGREYVQKMPGSKDAYVAGDSIFYGFGWPGVADYLWLYASGSRIYTYNGTVETNVTRYNTTPGDNDYNGGASPVWTGGILNGVPILTNTSLLDPPQQWDASLGRMKDLANWPAGTYCKTIRPFGSFLVALHIKDANGEFPYDVMWSHPADPGTVPATWAPSASTLAGRRSIGSTGGFLVDAVPMRNVLMLYKEDAVWGMQFVGGQSIFRTWEIFDSFGVFNRNCVVQFKAGQHFCLAVEDVIVHNGATWQSIAERRVRNAIFNELDTTNLDRAFVVHHPKEREIWVCIPTGAGVYASKAYVWNYVYDTWTTRDLDQAQWLMAVQNISGQQDLTWDAQNYTWDEAQGVWDVRVYGPANRDLVFFSGNGNNVRVEGSIAGGTGETLRAVIQRPGLALTGETRDGQPKLNLDLVKFCSGMRLHFDVAPSSTIYVYIASQDTPQGAITWNGPYSIDPGSEYWIDFEVSTRLVGFRIEDSMASDTQWRLSGIELDIMPQGRF